MRNIRVVENSDDFLIILAELAKHNYVYDIKRRVFYIVADSTEDHLLVMNTTTISDIEHIFDIKFDFILGLEE